MRCGNNKAGPHLRLNRPPTSAELQYYTYKYFYEINPELLLVFFSAFCWLVIFKINQIVNVCDEQFFKTSIENNMILAETILTGI